MWKLAEVQAGLEASSRPAHSPEFRNSTLCMYIIEMNRGQDFEQSGPS